MHDDTVLNNESGNILWVSDEICSNNHNKKRCEINNFTTRTKENEQQNNDEHLYTDEHIFTVKTERISSKNTVSTGKDI